MLYTENSRLFRVIFGPISRSNLEFSSCSLKKRRYVNGERITALKSRKRKTKTKTNVIIRICLLTWKTSTRQFIDGGVA